MKDNIRQLKKAYKEKKKGAVLSEKLQIRHDYVEMKKKLKSANKIIKKNNLLKSTDDFWSKFDFPSFEDYKKDNSSIEIDENLEEISEKIEELDKENTNKNSSKENMQYLFEQDENGTFIRLVIPATFVNTILSTEKIYAMDLRGKKNEELTTDEVIVLKKYAYELSEKNKSTKSYYK